MLLTIDAGNTRTKWAIFNAHGEILQTGACLNASFNSTSLSLETVSSVFISNVAGEAHAETMQAIFIAHNLQPQWLKSAAQCCDVINHYTQPETLGTDRWAALIAAWHMKHVSCVVVNAGTAVTIDALVPHASNHDLAEFLGGMILPGLNLMQSSLGNATAQLGYDAHPVNFSASAFNLCTADAMRNGALNAICGAIRHMLSEVAEKHQTMPLIMLSGGNAEVIKKHLSDIVTNQVLIVDNLVLNGLYLIHRTQHQ